MGNTRARIVMALLVTALAVVIFGTMATPAFASHRVVKFGVKSFGATGNGHTNDTGAFQRAVDAAHRSRYFGVVWVPRGTYAIAGVYISSDVHVWVQPGSRIVLAGGAVKNTPAFYFAKQGVYSRQASATGWTTHSSVVGYQGRFTIDLSNAPTTRNHAFKFINAKMFRVANVNIVMNNANKMGGSPSSYVAAMTFQSSMASRAGGPFYHPLYGLIENITVSHSPYGFGAAQITSGSRLNFRNIVSWGGIGLRFETDTPNPSRVNIVHGTGISCFNGHAAVSFSPKNQSNYDVHLVGVHANSCESGVRIAGGTGHFYRSSIRGLYVKRGYVAQVNNPRVGNPAIGAWLTGRSKVCVSRGAGIHYSVGFSYVRCGV
jgi:Pectate lyase superfamily protein